MIDKRAWGQCGPTIVVPADDPAPLGVQAALEGATEKQQYRIYNSSLNVVHLGIAGTGADAQAAAVAAAAGVPDMGIPLPPGIVEILTAPANSFFSGFAVGASNVFITPGAGGI